MVGRWVVYRVGMDARGDVVWEWGWVVRGGVRWVGRGGWGLGGGGVGRRGAWVLAAGGSLDPLITDRKSVV